MSLSRPLDRAVRSPWLWASLSLLCFIAGPIWIYFTPGTLPFLMLIPTGIFFGLALLMILIGEPE